VRTSWVHPDVAERIRRRLREGRSSWEEVFDADAVRAGEPPAGLEVAAPEWPRLAAHVARAERVREVIARLGPEAARDRFAASPHAVERVALLDGLLGDHDDDDAVAASIPDIQGILACEIDEWLVYGRFLSRLVELGMAADPRGTVAAFERYIAAASAISSHQPSWPERLRAARDGLASLYVRVGRTDDAEALFDERYHEEPADTMVPIAAARAFLEAGHHARAVSWLGRAAARAQAVGRTALADQLRSKIAVLRGRLN
jgi:hypothetical protein